MKERTKIVTLLNDSSFVGKQVTACGWVRTLRDGANNAFVALNDGSCLSNLQLFINKESLNDTLKSQFATISTGASLVVQGVLKESPAKGQTVELEVASFTVIGLSPSD
jgi:asparaginyl-tRNA synthetase